MGRTVLLLACVAGAAVIGSHTDLSPAAPAARSALVVQLVSIPGGTYQMGDVFGDGEANERPVHTVTLRSFSLAQQEVTVGQFRAFVDAASYRTSAEHPESRQTFEAIASRKAATGAADRLLLRYETLQEADGTAVWNVQESRWQVYQPGVSWRNPGFVQTDDHPVVAVSWDDAIHYCNWLSRREGLAPAYDETTGRLLDDAGAATLSTERVVGYRLPTEAEWEYAAAEGGRKVRFGNGAAVARLEEINFRADAGSYPYLEKAASYRKGTVAVASLPANRLGLREMSGNAWEWVSDQLAPYPSAPVSDPYVVTSDAVPQQILRGGRWGGDASEARVSARSGWVRNDRCNNSGFRVARSLPKAK